MRASAGEVERPLYARPATTATSFNADAYYEYFEGLTLQAAVDVDGWTMGFDFTVPVGITSDAPDWAAQVRLGLTF